MGLPWYTEERGLLDTFYGAAPSLALPSFSSWDISQLGGPGGREGRDGSVQGLGTQECEAPRVSCELGRGNRWRQVRPHGGTCGDTWRIHLQARIRPLPWGRPLTSRASTPAGNPHPFFSSLEGGGRPQ